MSVQVAFARDRETGELHLRFERGSWRKVARVTPADLEMMALELECGGDDTMAAMFRHWAQIGRETPLGQEAPFNQGPTFDADLEIGTSNTLKDWMHEK